MPADILARLKATFADSVLATAGTGNNAAAAIEPYRIGEVARFLRDEPDLALRMPIDCTAVDFLQVVPARSYRFEVVWHLYSVQHGHRIRIKVRVDEAMPQVTSLTPVWPGMNWHEREAWDLYGIRFFGHPNLRRVLMYEQFVGHPLRKDYPIDRRQPLVAHRPVRAVPTQRHAPRSGLNRP